MFQLWKVVLLCGLLSGTSASLLGGLGHDLSNVVNGLKPVIDRTLDTVDHTLEAVLGGLAGDLNVLQESRLWQLAKQKFQEGEKLLSDALSSILSIKDKVLGLKVSNAHIVDIKAELTSNGEGLNLRFPVTANVSVFLPVVGQAVNLEASLDILSGVSIATNAQTGVPEVVVADCASNPASVKFTLLGRHNVLVNKVTNTMSSFLSNTVSFLVQQQICPLIRLFISNVDVDFVQNVIDKLQQGVSMQVSI